MRCYGLRWDMFPREEAHTTSRWEDNHQDRLVGFRQKFAQCSRKLICRGRLAVRFRDVVLVIPSFACIAKRQRFMNGTRFGWFRSCDKVSGDDAVSAGILIAVFSRKHIRIFADLYLNNIVRFRKVLVFPALHAVGS